MSKAGESVMQGLGEALAFAQGDTRKATVHHVRVPDVDVRKICDRTGLSQAEFSRTIGVAKGTLLNWEQGRRRPTGPAMVLLAMLDRQPSLVAEMLEKAVFDEDLQGRLSAIEEKFDSFLFDASIIQKR